MNMKPNYYALACGLTASLYEPKLSLAIVIVLVTLLGLTSFQQWLTHKSADSQTQVDGLHASLSSLNNRLAKVEALSEKTDKQIQSANLSKLR